MDNAPSAGGPLLRERRDATIRILVEQFAQDRLTLDEFEQRLDRAHSALELRELDSLVSDLAPAIGEGAAMEVAAPAPRSLPSTDVRPHQTLIAIMSAIERRGRWTPARETNLFAVMGGGELDFREAQLGPGVTEINLLCVMGGALIIVPPGMAVDADGFALMGAFEHHESRTALVSPEAPVLRIRGFALMGGVEIEVRAPGETKKDARQRRRDERRRLRSDHGHGGDGA